MDTSKTSSIKCLLMQAWRERWSDVRWGINIKNVLPRGVSGDVYDLADCICQRALVGPNPNRLLVSYLAHCLASQIISYGATFASIARFELFSKIETVDLLLDVVVGMLRRVVCHGNEEECIALCKSTVGIALWLHNSMLHAAGKLHDFSKQQACFQIQQQQQQAHLQSQQPQHHQTQLQALLQIQPGQQPIAGLTAASTPAYATLTQLRELPLLSVAERDLYIQILKKSLLSLAFFSENSFLRALLYIGRIEEAESYALLRARHTDACQTLSAIMCSSTTGVSNGTLLQQTGLKRSVLENALSLVAHLDNIAGIGVQPSHHTSPVNASQTTCFRRRPGFVIGLVTNVTVEAILSPAKCVDSVAQVLQLCRQLLNIPGELFYAEILRSCLMGMSDSVQSNNDLRWAAFTFLKLPLVLSRMGSGEERSLLFAGIELLLSYRSLVDAADEKCNVDCIALVVGELRKMDLLSESDVQALLRARRYSEAPKEASGAAPSLIIKAEPTVKTILSTLDTDVRDPEQLLAVLYQMIPGKSFELILSAAASTGKLSVFVQKLVNFNNQNNTIVVDRSGESRAMLFDITFLMLCHIAQVYGVETVVRDETKDSVFAQWAPDCLVDPNRYTCPNKMLAKANPDKVDMLLRQMMRCGSEQLNEYLDFRKTHQRWSDLLYDLPAAVKEILIGWDHGVVPTNTVKAILDQIKSKMCFLPVIVSTWLGCYINILHHEECLKPINIMNQFQQAAKVGDEPGAQDYYKDRQALMASIVKKMMFHFHPSGQKKIGVLTDKTPLWIAIEEIFDNVHSGTWIDINTINNLNGILDVAGPIWFCDALIRQALKYQHQDDLNCAIELAYGIFQIDVQHCALALLTDVLPNYVLWESKQEYLTEPKGSALARLVTLTTMTALKLRDKQSHSRDRLIDNGSGLRRKHIFWDMELQESLSNHSRSKNKNRRINTDLESLEDTPHSLQCHNNKELLDPLDRALSELFRLLYSVATEPIVSQRSFFPLELFRQFVACSGGNQAVWSQVFQFLPLGFISQMVRAMPQSLTPNLILALSSFTTPRARKVVARAICQLQITQNSHVA